MILNNFFILKRTLNFIPKSAKYLLRSSSVWTHDNIIKSPYKDVEIPNCTLSEYVWQNLDKWAEKTAIVCAHTGRSYTYEQAFRRSNTFAANLRKKLNIRNGDVVAVMLPNLPEYPIVTLGILEAGAVMTSINPAYTAHEVQRQLLLSEAKIIVALPQVLKVVKDALLLAKKNLPIITVKINDEPIPEGTILFNELTEDLSVDVSILKEIKRDPNEICFLPFSSGTTGLPKGVELSHRNITVNGEQVNDPLIRCHNDTTATHQDRVIVVLPFYHVYAASVLMFHKLSLGLQLVTVTKFQPEAFFGTIEQYKTNLIFVAPPLLLLMGSHPAATEKTLQYVETIVNGAAPVSDTDVFRVFEKAKRKLDFRQGYGLTETAPAITLTPLNADKTYTRAGPPIPNTDLRIVDPDTLKNLGVNETGEILVRGPQVTRGYRNNPEANKEAFVDGWFRTGDLAVADNDGDITIMDRLKDLIKVKGYQVPPAELEAVLREHPSVRDSAVIGVPHAVNGEAPKAFVVLKQGYNNPAKEISEFVKQRVAPYKRVDDIVFIDSIPKNTSGKILRKELKKNYC
ncbi:hypothetical protein K1T71_008159 [Dendrolimus kikuchii]|uniref:Uncharacterized protein n=1 Tax=Dendrolimus kikuchii TaxID=765133 RepID=A0ACC1CWY7_9NEOP|nr:hypothetical protein K1T71_008159 [Dendrolimus kikuchii]